MFGVWNHNDWNILTRKQIENLIKHGKAEIVDNRIVFKRDDFDEKSWGTICKNFQVPVISRHFTMYATKLVINVQE